MRKIRLLIIICLLSISGIFAQDILWQKSLGGSGFDYGTSTIQTSDGGYIVAGYSASDDGDISNANGSYDYWVIKLNNLGNKIWETSLGGSNQDVANHIIETNDGGFIIVGYSISKDGDVSSPISTSGNYKDYWIVKISSTGTKIWEKSYGGSDHDVANYVAPTFDGGYVICGNTKSNDVDVSENYSAFTDAWLIKISSDGGLIWERNLGGSLDDNLNYITELSDGSFIAVGESKSNDFDMSENKGDYDAWVIKLSSTGTVIWSKSFGGEKSDIAKSAIVLSNGSIVFAGNSESLNGGFPQEGNGDYFVGKINSSGTSLWLKTYGGSDVDVAYSVCKNSNGNYVIAGSSRSKTGLVQENFGNADFWILELNSSGDTIWTKNYGGELDDVAYSINQNNDGSFIVVGSSNSTGGQITGNIGGQDYWIAKLNGFVGILELNNNYLIDIYPNPATNNVQIRINNEQLINNNILVYDIYGKLVISSKNDSQSQFIGEAISIDVSTLEPGVYFVKTGRYVGQFVKQ